LSTSTKPKAERQTSVRVREKSTEKINRENEGKKYSPDLTMFKLESYVTPIILSHVERYVKNVRAEQSQVGNGHVPSSEVK
jgi:hypothetical protein